MSSKVHSADLPPGTLLRHRDGSFVVLDRRKRPGDSSSPFLPGWWVTSGSGLADFVIDAEDSEWSVIE